MKTGSLLYQWDSWQNDVNAEGGVLEHLWKVREEESKGAGGTLGKVSASGEGVKEVGIQPVWYI